MQQNIHMQTYLEWLTGLVPPTEAHAEALVLVGGNSALIFIADRLSLGLEYVDTCQLMRLS